ncbi:MAG: MerR family transcriptional regulator [Pseudomonadota bacterium]
MSTPVPVLTPADAAKSLGISTKALRIYEQRGLITPLRSARGWRAYGPDQMSRAAEIVALRGLGFSLAQIASLLKEDDPGRAQTLNAQQTDLERQLREVSAKLEKVRGLRDHLEPPGTPLVAFDLPWPWGGERFELSDIRALTYIVGPLFSGKTKLAQRLAERLPGAAFIGLERLPNNGSADEGLNKRVIQVMDSLVEAGAAPSDSLIALLAALEAEGPEILLIDMVEQGLDEATQQALIAHLRWRDGKARPLFLLTRSSAILDLAAVGPDEAILLCPANHSPPIWVAPTPGARGYEVVASCLAPPEVRARSEGVIAWRPKVA